MGDVTYVVLTIPVHPMERSRMEELRAELQREVHVLCSEQVPEYAPREGDRFGVSVHTKSGLRP